MSKLINEYTEQKRLLVKALVEKDYMELYEAEALKNDFVMKLGEPRYELHKLELAIARTKLKLEMMETCEKFKIPIDHSHIDMELEKEFQTHYATLKSMKREIDYVHTIEDDEKERLSHTLEMKQIYLDIASNIHPELTFDQDKNLKRTWKAVKNAYQKGDMLRLKRLQKKVATDCCDISSEVNDDVENLLTSIKSKKKAVLNEIEKMKKRFPFSESNMLEDEAAVVKFKNDIDIDIKIAKEVLDKLEKRVLEKLPPVGRYKN